MKKYPIKARIINKQSCAKRDVEIMANAINGCGWWFFEIEIIDEQGRTDTLISDNAWFRKGDALAESKTETITFFD